MESPTRGVVLDDQEQQQHQPDRGPGTSMVTTSPTMSLHLFAPIASHSSQFDLDSQRTPQSLPTCDTSISSHLYDLNPSIVDPFGPISEPEPAPAQAHPTPTRTTIAAPLIRRSSPLKHQMQRDDQGDNDDDDDEEDDDETPIASSPIANRFAPVPVPIAAPTCRMLGPTRALDDQDMTPIKPLPPKWTPSSSPVTSKRSMSPIKDHLLYLQTRESPFRDASADASSLLAFSPGGDLSLLMNEGGSFLLPSDDPSLAPLAIRAQIDLSGIVEEDEASIEPSIEMNHLLQGLDESCLVDQSPVIITTSSSTFLLPPSLTQSTRLTISLAQSTTLAPPVEEAERSLLAASTASYMEYRDSPVRRPHRTGMVGPAPETFEQGFETRLAMTTPLKVGTHLDPTSSPGDSPTSTNDQLSPSTPSTTAEHSSGDVRHLLEQWQGANKSGDDLTGGLMGANHESMMMMGGNETTIEGEVDAEEEVSIRSPLMKETLDDLPDSPIVTMGALESIEATDGVVALSSTEEVAPLRDMAASTNRCPAAAPTSVSAPTPNRGLERLRLKMATLREKDATIPSSIDSTPVRAQRPRASIHSTPLGSHAAAIRLAEYRAMTPRFSSGHPGVGLEEDPIVRLRATESIVPRTPVATSRDRGWSTPGETTVRRIKRSESIRLNSSAGKILFSPVKAARIEGENQKTVFGSSSVGSGTEGDEARPVVEVKEGTKERLERFKEERKRSLVAQSPIKTEARKARPLSIPNGGGIARANSISSRTTTSTSGVPRVGAKTTSRPIPTIAASSSSSSSARATRPSLTTPSSRSLPLLGNPSSRPFSRPPTTDQNFAASDPSSTTSTSSRLGTLLAARSSSSLKSRNTFQPRVLKPPTTTTTTSKVEGGKPMFGAAVRTEPTMKRLSTVGAGGRSGTGDGVRRIGLGAAAASAAGAGAADVGRSRIGVLGTRPNGAA